MTWKINKLWFGIKFCFPKATQKPVAGNHCPANKDKPNDLKQRIPKRHYLSWTSFNGGVSLQVNLLDDLWLSKGKAVTTNTHDIYTVPAMPGASPGPRTLNPFLSSQDGASK